MTKALPVKGLDFNKLSCLVGTGRWGLLHVVGDEKQNFESWSSDPPSFEQL